jgi:alkanesulfonate monooxygenase SsuD/methylene tetrahydromethanopterin reductase-like flavin-dependent oxidoreductase (luciferase family)
VTGGLPALAVTVPQYRDDPRAALAACRDAHRLGYAGAFLFDHLWPLGGPPTRPALECWTLLAALAAAVGEAGAGGFRLGTLVTRAGLRPPALLARMAATVGAVAGTPAIVGVGRGDALNRAENLAFGVPYPDAAGRALAVERTVAALRGAAAGRPAPEVWVGGAGPAMQALAGRLADAWNGWALRPEELAAGLAVARRAAAAGGGPAAVAATWGGQVLVGESRADAGRRLRRWAAGRPAGETARVVAGDAEQVLARLAAFGEAGAGWCVLAFVGGPAAPMRARLAAAARLAIRNSPGEESDAAAEA